MGEMTARAIAELRALTEVAGIGDKRAAALYRSFGSLDELAAASLDAFDDIHYVDAETLAAIRQREQSVATYERQLETLRSRGVAVIGVEDDRYPPAVRDAHAPVVLYARGEVALLSEPAVAFAGSRETETAGCTWTREVASEVADTYVVVSGGATGVDTAAHRGALDAGGDTIVVYGTGLDTPYPPENEPLFEEIVDAGGLLLSQRPPDAGPDRHAFLRRNQTSAALGAGVVIPAAAASSGTMSQFDDARRQERPVFVPTRELGFSPVDGVATMRDDKGVTAVSEADDVVAALADTGTDHQQASLDNW